ncbi:hypothetical protein MUP32_02145 [Candidatus Microgenomates bacterium]|nr:hypothetical protein [Candidatus Microgenomates bacterium]
MMNWDYDIKPDWKPKTPEEWRWFLVRKINYNDLRDIPKDTLKYYFPVIRKYLDPGKKELLNYFLNNR